MDDEFALCWNNFQENISSGFQLLYDRGDLVDVTIAVDGKLLHCHKIVLAICSPYFQEIFNTNPCKHPIIILKDVSFSVMCELLQFIYQGVVNVKHTELSSFMKIAQTLQIKGLATSATQNLQLNQQHQHQSPRSNTPKSLNPNENIGIDEKPQISPNFGNNQQSNRTTNNLNISENSSSSVSSNNAAAAVASSVPMSLKRLNEFPTDSLSIYSRSKQLKRNSLSTELTENNNNDNDSLDQINSHDDVFLPPIPQISIGNTSNETRFDLTNVKREINESHHHHHHQHHHHQQQHVPGSTESPPPSSLQQQQQQQQQQQSPNSPTLPPTLRNPLPPPFNNLEYNMYAAAAAAAAGNKNFDYPTDLHLSASSGPSDYSSKGNSSSNHMDIPQVAPGERWFHGKLEFMLSQRGKPLLVHDGHTFGIQYIRKDKKYWQCNLSRKFNCKARVTTTDLGEIIVTNNEHCHTEIRQHLRKDYQRNKILNAFGCSIQERMLNASTNEHNSQQHNSNRQQHHNMHKQTFNENLIKAHFFNNFNRNLMDDDNQSDDDIDENDKAKYNITDIANRIWQQVNRNNSINNNNNNINTNNNSNNNTTNENDNDNEAMKHSVKDRSSI